MCSSEMLSTTGSPLRGQREPPRTSAMANSAKAAIAERMAMVHSAEKLSRRTLLTGQTRPQASTTVMSAAMPARRDASGAAGLTASR